ncbi:MAG: Flagellar hook-length control protein FliK [Sphingomonas bacterium]|uniref:flagellar hook-length control protein FliK n=1 Tax=Sphingomonas bacterium TaxID=1895847 RepID=UPI0026064DC2|nr:flagellar hook-length control protein FliK [Sphingomonas bacterium]MDB5706661.1 Flagellar hook-length control protein FliK [Sphingomonas bacterium]
MIELSTQLTQSTSPVSVPAAPGGAAGGFVQVLAAFLDANAGAAPDAPADPGLPADRQGLADDGKTLPDDVADDDDGDDAALVWLPAGMAVPLPIVQPIRLPAGMSLSGARLPELAGETALKGSQATMGVQLNGTQDLTGDQAATAMPAVAGDSAGIDTPPVTALSTTPVKDSSRVKPAQGLEQPPAAIAPTAQPAGQAFAAAIAAASANHERPGRDDDRPDSQNPSNPLVAAQAETASKPIVQAVADAKHAPLDLRDDRGLQGMIDRIETLRDDANARDTRIRLVPDALGGVDVAVRKDGDIVHVHFTADTQATRTLLSDAQPRLAELAEARGVKLGQTSVDAGTGGTNQQPRPEAPRAQAPVSALIPDEDLSIDQRLA